MQAGSHTRERRIPESRHPSRTHEGAMSQGRMRSTLRCAPRQTQIATAAIDTPIVPSRGVASLRRCYALLDARGERHQGHMRRWNKKSHLAVPHATHTVTHEKRIAMRPVYGRPLLTALAGASHRTSAPARKRGPEDVRRAQGPSRRTTEAPRTGQRADGWRPVRVPRRVPADPRMRSVRPSWEATCRRRCRAGVLAVATPSEQRCDRI
jgi:hypothetical protein